MWWVPPAPFCWAGRVPSSGCGSLPFSVWVPFMPKRCWHKRHGSATRTGRFWVGRSITSGRPSTGALAGFWRAFLPLRCCWLWAFSAAWCSPTPSVRPFPMPSASPPGWWEPYWSCWPDLWFWAAPSGWLRSPKSWCLPWRCSICWADLRCWRHGGGFCPRPSA